MKFICTNALVFMTLLCSDVSGEETKIRIQRIGKKLTRNGPKNVLTTVELDDDCKGNFTIISHGDANGENYKGKYLIMKVKKSTKNRLKFVVRLLTGENKGKEIKFYVKYKFEKIYQNDLLDWLSQCAENIPHLEFNTCDHINEFRSILKDSLRMHMTKTGHGENDKKRKSRLMKLHWENKISGSRRPSGIEDLKSLTITMPRNKDTTQYNDGFGPKDQAEITKMMEPRSYWRNDGKCQSMPSFIVEVTYGPKKNKKKYRTILLDINDPEALANTKKFILSVSEFCKEKGLNNIFEGYWNDQYIKKCFDLPDSFKAPMEGGAKTVVNFDSTNSNIRRRLAEAERQ